MLIMRHVSVIEEDACQVQKGCRYDEAGQEGCGSPSSDALFLFLRQKLSITKFGVVLR